MSDMASNTIFPQFKTTGDERYGSLRRRPNRLLYHAKLVRSIQVNRSSEVEETRDSDGMSSNIVIPCSQSSLERQLSGKSIKALASGSRLGEGQKFFSFLQNEEESIASWETRIRNQAVQCEYGNLADELMTNQFIAGLTSKPLY